MKIKFAWLLSAVLLLVGVQSSQAVNNTVTFYVTPYDGGSESQFSWTLTGEFTNGGMTMSAGDLGVSGFGVKSTDIFSTPASSSMYTQLGDFSVAGGGTVTSTAGTLSNLSVHSGAINDISLFQTNGSDYVSIFIGNGATAVGGPNNTILYTPGTDSYIIPYAFSNFNPGIYSNSYGTDNTEFLQAFTQTLDIESVPEPSTYVLLGIGALGILIAFPRKKTA